MTAYFNKKLVEHGIFFFFFHWTSRLTVKQQVLLQCQNALYYFGEAVAVTQSLYRHTSGASITQT